MKQTIRFVTGNFLDEYDPTIEDSYRKSFYVQKFQKNVLLDILDTAGQEDFSALRDQWMREAQAFVVMYSINYAASFDEAKTMIERIPQIKSTELSNLPVVRISKYLLHSIT